MKRPVCKRYLQGIKTIDGHRKPHTFEMYQYFQDNSFRPKKSTRIIIGPKLKSVNQPKELC